MRVSVVIGLLAIWAASHSVAVERPLGPHGAASQTPTGKGLSDLAAAKAPGSEYEIHDTRRPQPPVVNPGAESAFQSPGRAPSDAVVLFDGTNLSGWTGIKGAARWKVENGYMEVVPGTGPIQTAQPFGDSQIHIEWTTPSAVKGEGQSRGNSGVFLMGRYEIQVLDSFQNTTYADGCAAAIYGQYPPLVNACRKPGEWQTYDIVWLGPRFDGERLLRPAVITLFHNGVLAQYHVSLAGPSTPEKKILPYKPHLETGPLELQDHGDPVRFRNIWYRPILARK